VLAQTPEGKRTLRGRIAALEGGIDPALSAEFGMLVTVAFPEMDMAATRARLPHLMPVRLRARRDWAVMLSERWDRVTGWFGR
jgi:hypothetical protein